MSRSENIHVSLRFRPLSYKEIEEAESIIWTTSSSTISLKQEWLQYLLDYKRLTRLPRSYTYNHCFTSYDKNSKVYDTVAKRVVLASLDGYNGTIFVYGQTGSGKTYTMMGNDSCQDGLPQPPKKTSSIRQGRSVSPIFRSQSFTPIPENSKDKGILLYALEDLFSYINLATDRNYCLTCSYLEIYNEQVFDLIEFSKDALIVNEDPDKGFYVRGASEHAVDSLHEIIQLIVRGESNRKYASTLMNHHSSRSHTIFKLNVTSVSNKDSSSLTTESTLNFVDLAGSERVSSLNQSVSIEPSHKFNRSRESLDVLLAEGKHINTSLFYLCQVINRLSEKNTNDFESHIPYRNSNLTKILRSSLGGNSLTCIICTAVPTLSQFEMTLSTLRFGGIAKTITNNIEVNIKGNCNSEVLQSYQKDLENLRRELENTQAGGRIKAEEAATVRKKLEERVSRLTQMLFNQSRKKEEKREENEGIRLREVWCLPAGDLAVDSRVIRKSEGLILDFDRTGAFALERMRNMNKDIRKMDLEAKELIECKDSLFDSKINLKNDLKQALVLCQQLSNSKQKYKEKCNKIKRKLNVIQQRLGVVEEHRELSNLSKEQLEELEKFYFTSLDSVKNVRFRRKYESKLNELQREKTIIDSPERPKQGLELLKSLESNISFSSSDSSFEFESSFYKNAKDKDMYSSFASHDLSTLIFDTLENDDFYKPSKPPFRPKGIPLSEISPYMLNNRIL